jgi:hypothetical protein
VRKENSERESSQKTLPEISPEMTGNAQYTDEQLEKSLTERHTLIELLFETYTQEQLSLELPLINEMVSLDNQLTSNSKQYKQALGAQVIQLKKSKKIARIYKKY